MRLDQINANMNRRFARDHASIRAVRIDAIGDLLTRTVGLLNPIPSTYLGWFMMTPTIRYGSCFNVLANTPGNIRCILDGAGPHLVINVGGADLPGATNIQQSRWYHVGFVIAGTGATDIKGYLNGNLEVSGTGTAGMVSQSQLRVGNDGTNWLNGRCAAIKIWRAALTTEEIQMEMQQVMPVRYAGLYNVSPFVDPLDNNLVAMDYSGAGTHWTVAGTLTLEDGPPIPWMLPPKRARRRVLFAATVAAGPTDGELLAMLGTPFRPGFVSSGPQEVRGV